MGFGLGWSRRKFLAVSGAAATQAAAELKGLGQAGGAAEHSRLRQQRMRRKRRERCLRRA